MISPDFQRRADGWRNFFEGRASTATHALTLCYNNVFGATASWCFRLTEHGEYERLPTTGVPVEPGVHRLPTIRRVSLEKVHADLEKWHYYTDRDLYGPRFYKRPENGRSSFVGSVEHPDTNVHVHLLWTMPEAEAEALADFATRRWKEITDGYGSVVVKGLHDGEGWAAYCLKEQRGIALDGDPLRFVSSMPVRKAKSHT